MELERDASVILLFQSSAHDGFAVVEGTASISTDPEKIRELWEPVARTWFTEGETDPRITIIKVTPSHGHYWDTKHGAVVVGVKMLLGSAIGRTLDDSVQGEMNFEAM